MLVHAARRGCWRREALGSLLMVAPAHARGQPHARPRRGAACGTAMLTSRHILPAPATSPATPPAVRCGARARILAHTRRGLAHVARAMVMQRAVAWAAPSPRCDTRHGLVRGMCDGRAPARGTIQHQLAPALYRTGMQRAREWQCALQCAVAPPCAEARKVAPCFCGVCTACELQTARYVWPSTTEHARMLVHVWLPTCSGP